MIRPIQNQERRGYLVGRASAVTAENIFQGSLHNLFEGWIGYGIESIGKRMELRVVWCIALRVGWRMELKIGLRMALNSIGWRMEYKEGK